MTQPRVYSSTLLGARRGARRAWPARSSAPILRGPRYLFELTSRASAVAQGADRRRDRHVVVVQNHDQPVARRLGIVHRLIGHAGAEARRRRSPRSHGPASPDSLLAMAKPSAAEIEVELCAAPNGSYSLSAAPGEAVKPAALAKRADAVAPAGHDLVRIGLVADVPDQFVAGVSNT